MTTMRGLVKTREWMRTQDPRLAPSTELAAKDDGRIAFFPPRMLSGKAPLFPERGRGDGALRRNTESRGPQQPVEAVHEEAPLPLVHRRVGRGTASGRSQEDAQFTPALATCTIRGYTPYHNQSQTGMLDYTGEKYDTLPPGLPANLNKIKFVKNLLANTRSVLGGGRSVAVLCALSGNTIACSCSTRAAVLLGKQQQQLSSPSGRHKAPTEVPSAKCQARDQEGRLRHRHGRAGEPRDPGEGPEGAEDTLGNSVTSQESGQSASFKIMFVCVILK